ncbi:putative dehydrogenase [Anoxybacillus voinovskiensis]|uniref:Putative dehydrogenase n=1 Tax=Anoxybacteroides voinovskiense TaxID=230470 RepID=A0A840DQT9_9BACL|nr:Gfo/Idh/MocA family oxidoreductase [Anoxybacillus voinovskiensis]MBB4072408.1 putative dehydrogenase [Anoxybacillus voinovskiensis]GGJ58122.1 deoxyfructose oxidoreductase [Anoxybacillus voinovskiensis]
MGTKVRWGILSTAAIARSEVIPAIQRAENAEIVAIASGSGKAHEVAQQLGIPTAYNNYEDLLADPNIDAVYIPLPNHMHMGWTVKAAKQKKHILCEKPAALCEEDVRKMVEACQENGVVWMEAFMYQFHPQHNRVKEIIASGEIGTVKSMRSSFSFYLVERENNIRMEPACGGGSLLDVGCYCVHSIRYLLETEPVALSVHSTYDDRYGVDVITSGWMLLENGVHALFDCSFDMFARNEYEIIGTNGKITVPRAYRPDVQQGSGLLIIQTDDGKTREEVVNGDQYRLQVEHFSQCIIDGTTPSYSPDAIIRQAKVLDACRTSASIGKAVEL